MIDEPRLLPRGAAGWQRSLAVSSLVWLAAALYTLGRSWLQGQFLQIDGGFLPSLGAELRALLVWAVATPFILASARRFPLPHVRWRRNLAVHVVASILFVYLLQLLVALPGLLAGELGVVDLAREGVGSFLNYYHLAGLVYGIVLGVGFLLESRARGAIARPSAHAMASGSVAGTARPGTEIAPEESAGEIEPSPTLDRLAVRTRDGILVVDVDEIAWIEADGDYARLHVGGRELLLRESLKRLEKRLDPERFVRIHRSAIVRLARVRRLSPQVHGDYSVQLDDGTQLRLSRTRRDALARLLDHPL